MKRLPLFALALLSTLSALALELRLTPSGVAIQCDAPKCSIMLDWPKMTGGGERAPKVESLSDREAVLVYPNGTRLRYELAEGGELRVTPIGGVQAPDSGVSHSFSFPTALAAQDVFWAYDGAKPQPLPKEKLADAFLFKGDAKALSLTTADGRGFVFALPYGWQQFQDNRHWNNNQSFQVKTFSGIPADNSTYVYSVKDAQGGPVVLGKSSPLDPHAYVPYPEPREELWPGHGPIRTFGWQDGIRRRYNARREQDENAVFFIGDSLTENWRTMEQDLAGWKVANRGLGGDTTRGMRWRLFADVLDHKPTALVILGGGNDLTAHGNPEHTIENLTAMVDQARAHESRMPIFLCTVPPSSQPDAPLKPGALDAVNAGIRKLAAEKKVVLIDLHDACLLPDGTQNLDLFAKDRLHLGPQGYVVWTKLMKRFLADDALAGTPGAPAREKISLDGYRLVWGDEFDGDALDTTKWDSPHQNRQDASIWDKRNVHVGDGMLTMDIRKTDDPHWRYESACIRTRKDYHKDQTMFEYTYGYIEARMKLPKHLRSDYWVGFWLMAGNMLGGNDADTRNGCEIDILETFDTWNIGRTKHTVHWGGYGKSHNAHGVSGGPHLGLLNEDFHTFGLLWEPDAYSFVVDGEVVWKTDFVGLGSDKDGKRKSLGVCHEPAYVKLSVEAAPWSGPRSEWEKEQPESDSLVVDYVRVYQRP